MVLKLTVVGNLGKDCTMQEVNGKKVLNFAVAHSEKYKNAQGVDVEKTTWVECSKWDSENIAPYLKKGVLVMCEGVPQAYAYTGKETGELKSSLKLNVQMLKLLSAAPKPQTTGEVAATPAATQAPQQQVLEPSGVVDDLPF